MNRTNSLWIYSPQEQASTDPNSGKIFDTSIIDSEEQSTPLQLTDVKVGDEIPYYCMIHSSMKGKLIVIAPTVG
jgi:hypothetical protein